MPLSVYPSPSFSSYCFLSRLPDHVKYAYVIYNVLAEVNVFFLIYQAYMDIFSLSHIRDDF